LKTNLTPTQNLLIEEIEQKLCNQHIAELSSINEFDFTGKSSIYHLLMKVLFHKNSYNANDFKEEGLMIKTVPVDLNYKPFEAMSFSCNSLKEIIYEEWDTKSSDIRSDLLSNLLKVIVMIPIIKSKQKGSFNSWYEWKTGELVVFKPNEKELHNISIEWRLAQQIIKDGIIVSDMMYGNGTRQTNNLLKASKTKYIHMRPHGANKYDIDLPYKEYTNGKIDITKQSFWLNKKYVQEILKKNRWTVN
jgi:DNA mismatch repair protein MutH